MTILVIRPGILALLLGSLLFHSTTYAEDSPHWNKDGCQTCHVEAAPVDGVVNLNATDAEALCETCHGDRGDALPCRHASGVAVGNVTVADKLQSSLKDGQLVCSTCHDIVYQCERPRMHFSLQNRGFLRDRTSRQAGDYCYKCHDQSAYAKLNPHAGVAGSPPRQTCLLCHESVPETSATGELVVNFNMQTDLNDACRGCHDTPPHPKSMSFSKKAPDGWVHLRQPSDGVRERMRETQTLTGIELPLDPQTGEIYCATCHNPHDFKIGGEHGSQSRNAKYRLRLDNICQACHEK